MKTLNPVPKFLIYAVAQAIRHPRTPITYGYCSECRVRVPANSGKCPKCGKEIKKNPETRVESPVPWWGAVICIVIGITSWVISSCLEVPGLDEAARVLVYGPVSFLFGMSMNRG
jgi:hypothetical protein